MRTLLLGLALVLALATGCRSSKKQTTPPDDGVGTVGDTSDTEGTTTAGDPGAADAGMNTEFAPPDDITGDFSNPQN